MPCEHNFGIIESLDAKKDYGDLGWGCEFSDILKTYRCENIDDDAINGWWPRVESMAVYWNGCPRAGKGLARCGVTLIPPESLGLFHSIVKDGTPPEFSEQAEAVLAVIGEARRRGKFVVHFGV